MVRRSLLWSVWIHCCDGRGFTFFPPGLLCGDGFVNEVGMCLSQYSNNFLFNFIYNIHNQNIILCSLYEASVVMHWCGSQSNSLNKVGLLAHLKLSQDWGFTCSSTRVDGSVVRIVARRRYFHSCAYPVNLKLQMRSLQMQQEASLKAVKQLCGFVMAFVLHFRYCLVVCITIPGKCGTRSYWKIRKTLVWPCLPSGRSLPCVNSLLFSAFVSVFADVKELCN
jgi:hypothetical protein